MLHAGGDGRSNGVGIIVNVEISKEVVRLERWQGVIIAIWMVMGQLMVCVICSGNTVYLLFSGDYMRLENPHDQMV